MFQAVLDALQSFGSFSTAELSFFESRLVEKEVPKMGFIVKEGMVCQAIYFLMRGSAVHKLRTEAGTDQVINLYVPGNWLTDYQSFTSQKPALAHIEAFEDCRLAMLNVHVLHELVLHAPVFFRAGRLLETMQYTDLATLPLSPEERYRHLLTQRPDLLQLFPLKLLASYLRMAPETLSRIRKRIR